MKRIEEIKEVVKDNDVVNYIINLQQENEKLKAINEEYERLNKEKGRGFKILNVESYIIHELIGYKNIVEELKKYIRVEWYCYDNESIEHLVARDILDKLEELEKRDNK